MIGPSMRPWSCRDVTRTWYRRSGRQIVGFLLVISVTAAVAADLPDTIEALKPSIVGVGTMSYARRPAGNLLGTGFVVADGRHIATNAHVIPDRFDDEEFVAIFVARGKKVRAMRSKIVARDVLHDLVVVRFDGPPMVALTLAVDNPIREGELLAFTGYPTETLHGIHAATHRGIVSSIIQVSGRESKDGQRSSDGLVDAEEYALFQLDATAFPGNSGSPLYRPGDGVVVGVVSKISAKDAGDGKISESRGVTYAVPARHVRELLKRAGFSE